MPAGDRDPLFFTKLVQSAELVVDQRLQRRDIQHADTGGRVLVQQGQDGEKRRLRLARCGGGRQEHIVFRPENGLSGGILHTPQRLPSGAIDIVLDKRRVSAVYVHI